MAKKATKTERAADRKLVDRSIAMLAAHDRATAQSARVIGEHLLDEYFGGDFELARSKSSVKPKSFALLAKRAASETDWNARQLREAVLMAIAYRSLTKATRDAIHPDLMLRLASIEDVKARRALAARLAAGELAGETARRAISEAGAGERRGGRARHGGAERWAQGLVRAVGRAVKGKPPTKSELSEVERTRRRELAAELRELSQKLAALAKQLAG